MWIFDKQKIIITIKIILGMILFCASCLWGLRMMKSIAKTEIQYHKEIRSFKASSEPMELLIPEWNWYRYIKIGTIDQIDDNFATLFYHNQKNLIIAGHDIDRVFHSLQKIEIGMEVLLKQEKQTIRYRVEKIMRVFPEEIQYLEETSIEQLTLITCTENNRKRLIVICSRVS